MVNLETVRKSNADLIASQPLVGVFIGVAGIAGYSLRTLAATHGTTGKGLRAYIVGRSAASVEALIAECKQSCPAGQFIFVQADNLALMKDVDRVSADLIELERKEAAAAGVQPKIDILVMCQATHGVRDPRNDTPEGLDSFMSLLYYSRMKTTLNLLPLLLQSPLPAHIISVFGPGRDTTIYPDDLSLRDPKKYSFWYAGCHVAYLTTFFMEYLAAKYPGRLALVHYYPGLVFTPAFSDPKIPWPIRAVIKYGKPVLNLLPRVVQPAECGERVLFNATARFPARSVEGQVVSAKTKGGVDVAVSSDGVLGGGAYRGFYDGEIVPLGKQYPKLREEGMLDKVVEHTLKAFEDIEGGKAFTG